MPSVTLEQYECAHIQARGCWLWPEEHEIRAACVEACALVGIDYPAAIGRLRESTGASADTARREFAEGLRRAADRVYAIHGYTPLADSIPDTLPDWVTGSEDT